MLPRVGVGKVGMRMLTIMVQLDAVGPFVKRFAKFPLPGDIEQGNLQSHFSCTCYIGLRNKIVIDRDPRAPEL